MTEQELLKRKISVEDFAEWELHLYLDTHPQDAAAKMAMNGHVAKKQELKQQYESKYGPLTGPLNFAAPTRLWLKDPWPWEYEEEDE
ncbi:MAG: spore coat protein CotJB [Oscillospiraceae bacterium]|nr:spore coat protein CotJB [Oscillospiraceae bacterium]